MAHLEKYTGVLGLIVIVLIAYLFSKDRKAIQPRVIFWGLGLQLTIAFLLLWNKKWPIARAFETASSGVNHLLDYAAAGSGFVFGDKLGVKNDQFGVIFAFQVLPIVIDDNGVIVDGHAVWEELKGLGHTEVQVVVAANRTLAEVRTLRLALNRVAEDAVWENEKLRAEFAELIELGIDLDLTGFDTVEIDMTLSIGEPTGDAVEEVAASDLTPKAGEVTEDGDVWRAGRHLIACGDARDKDLLLRLTAGRRVAAVFTDPPYNVRIDGNVSGLGRTQHAEFAMASGEMTREQFTAFLGETFAALLPLLADGAIVFVAMDWRHIEELTAAGKS